MVPNPSFETYTVCPDGAAFPNEISKAIPWNNPTGCSPDYFNICGLADVFNIPVNFRGYQYARTGVAYSGIGVFVSQTPDISEYIQIKLSDTLVVNKQYCVSFYASLADSSGYAVNKLGAYFSFNTFFSSGCSLLNYIPQVVNSSQILNNKNDWTKISGTFISTGGEQYMTIGNFFSYPLCDTVFVGNGPNDDSYYFIDDVSVFEITNADAGIDMTVCNEDSVQIGSTNYSEFTYSWQPTIGLSNPNSGITKAKPLQTTTYYLTQISPCSITTDSITVTVCDSSSLPSSLQVPNIFTPNNDGINDEFRIKTKNIASVNCKIYNRWGILVGELTAPNEVWQGRTTSGMQASQGVYYYILTATGNDGKEYNEKGFVQLLR